MNFFNILFLSLRLIFNVYFLLACGAASLGDCSQSGGHIFTGQNVECFALDILTLEGENTTLGRNVGHQSPTDAEKYPKRTET